VALKKLPIKKADRAAIGLFIAARMAGTRTPKHMALFSPSPTILSVRDLEKSLP
jgi:hypothetical protein